MTTSVFGSNTGNIPGTLAGTKNSPLVSGAPTSNFTGAGDHSNGLLDWTSMAATLSGETVTDAFITVVPIGTGGASGVMLCREILVAWGESTSTWNNSDTGTAWDASGCATDGVDRGATQLCTLTDVGFFVVDPVVSTGNTNLIAYCQAVADGTTKRGIFIDNNVANHAFRLPGSTDTLRPTLTVVHAAGGGRIMGAIAGGGGLAGVGGLAGARGGLAG